MHPSDHVLNGQMGGPRNLLIFSVGKELGRIGTMHCPMCFIDRVAQMILMHAPHFIYFFPSTPNRSLKKGFTTERGGPPVEQNSSGRASGGVGRQSRADALLAVDAGTRIVATEALERSRVHQKVAWAERV